ncbi:ATP-dependent DNA helicase [Mycena indigotica]|uniref:ATP-dependent DNA helicase n=1 Tax=Mycena indigotica TaxID=2126181 RepID=A0A8H6SE17_9AGAR|nr:ATP-dependent DNA helicase [Mycena indigotica]KAF7297045.1 ATP-dependent DNA helicase [Mycena indigotica]
MDEHATYVPADNDSEDEEGDDDEGMDGDGEMYTGTFSDYRGHRTAEDSEDEEEQDPDVFPTQASGVIDTVGDEVTDSDLFSHATSNLFRDYGVRRGSAFVNEYARTDKQGNRFDGGPGDPNHILGSFPCLFPYGMGGLEVDRETDAISMRHPFHVHDFWGHQQTPDVSRSKFDLVNRSSFTALQTSFLLLQPKDFMVAAEEEAKRKLISNPAVRNLRRQLTAVRSKVSGTDESRIAIRGQIWGMTLRFNPPTIWATLNLSDVGDPIAQVLAGEEIDLDAFVKTSGPTSKQRRHIIANDPYASAEFFHTELDAIGATESICAQGRSIWCESHGHRIPNWNLFGNADWRVARMEGC